MIFWCDKSPVEEANELRIKYTLNILKIGYSFFRKVRVFSCLLQE